LGNVVVSHAIQTGGLTVVRYMMINAAVPLEAYEPGVVTDQQRRAMTERKWKEVGDSSIFAANWHEFFHSSPEDFRGRLKWKELFKDVDKVAYNFFSPGDDVLEDARWDSPSMLKLVLEQGFDFPRSLGLPRSSRREHRSRSRPRLHFSGRTQGGWGQSCD
jgi:hypothetical protein